MSTRHGRSGPATSIRTPRADTSHAAIARAVSSTVAPSTSNVTSVSAYADLRSWSTRRARAKSPGSRGAGGGRCAFPGGGGAKPLAVPLDRGADVVDAVVAEFLAGRVGEPQREHRLRDDARRGHDAHVAALDVRGRRRA